MVEPTARPRIPNQKMPYCRKPLIPPTHPRNMIPSGRPKGAAVAEEEPTPSLYSSSECDPVKCEDDTKCGDEEPLNDNNDLDKEVAECNENDVLSGRGKSNQKHPGNRKYQDLINENAERYVGEQNNNEKRRIQAEIIEAIERDGGKFLKPNSKSRGWLLVPSEETRQKVAHALQYRVCISRDPDVVVAAATPTKTAAAAAPSSSEPRSGRKRAVVATERRKKRQTKLKAAVDAHAPTDIPLSHRDVCTDLLPVMSSNCGDQYEKQEPLPLYHHQVRYNNTYGEPEYDHEIHHQGGCFHLSAKAYSYPKYYESQDEYFHHHAQPQHFFPTAPPDTVPFDAFNAGFMVTPVGDSSDSDDSSGLLHQWQICRDE